MTWRPLPRPAGDGPRPIAAGLGSVARRLRSAPPPALATVFGRWPELVGPELAARCRPLAVRDGVLIVAVDDAAAATEVRFSGPAILRRAEELTGGPVAERLEVRVRPFRHDHG